MKNCNLSRSKSLLMLLILFAVSTLSAKSQAVSGAVSLAPVIKTVAGSSGFGCSGDGGLATSASLFTPYGVAIDSTGNFYVADFLCHSIRSVNAATGVIATVAGNGTSGYSGDGGPATNAMLNSPFAVAVDSARNIYIADGFNNRIRRVDAATGAITTVAGNGVGGYSGDGGAAISSELNIPTGIAVDKLGNLFIADTNNNVVREVAASTGIITTVAGNGAQGYSGDGGRATSANLNYPTGIAVDSAGNLFFADANNNLVRKVAISTGTITTVAGSFAGGSRNLLKNASISAS